MRLSQRVRYLVVACVLIAIVVPAAFMLRAHAESEFSLEVRTWSCPDDPSREVILRRVTRPESCTPLAVTGELRAKHWVFGTRIGEVILWEDAEINGSAATIKDIPLNGSSGLVQVQVPAAPDTGSIAFLAHDPATDETTPGGSIVAQGWIGYETGEAQAEASFEFGSNSDRPGDIVLDVLYLASPYEMVADSSITLHRWSCPGTRIDFDPATCTEGIDASPYLWSGPNVEDNAPGRFPSYESEGSTGVYRDLDPLVYGFTAADVGLARATISDRVLVIPVDEPQEIANTVFGPAEPDDKYASFAVEISAAHPAWEFNVYEFEDATSPSPSSSPSPSG